MPSEYVKLETRLSRSVPAASWSSITVCMTDVKRCFVATGVIVHLSLAMIRGAEGGGSGAITGPGLVPAGDDPLQEARNERARKI